MSALRRRVGVLQNQVFDDFLRRRESIALVDAIENDEGASRPALPEFAHQTVDFLRVTNAQTGDRFGEHGIDGDAISPLDAVEPQNNAVL